MTRIAATGPRSGGSSSALCRRALEAYDTVRAAAARYDDPDLGLAIICHLGRARLAARLDAKPWSVASESRALAERLIDAAPRNARCEDLVDWLEGFPGAFLSVLDRRAHQTAPLDGGRRAWDRISTR